MSIDIFAESSIGFLPNPLKNQIKCIFYTFHQRKSTQVFRGLILVQDNLSTNDSKCGIERFMFTDFKITDIFKCETEESCIRILIMMIYFYNPDVIWAFENQKYGLNYIKTRFNKKC